ncbi:hypothetical protein ERJ75_000582800 [Trypanosoma vivax]|nr:hypothetical protein ERJ75_000582800 [Trypanosoma vivax]
MVSSTALLAAMDVLLPLSRVAWAAGGAALAAGGAEHMCAFVGKVGEAMDAAFLATLKTAETARLLAEEHGRLESEQAVRALAAEMDCTLDEEGEEASTTLAEVKRALDGLMVGQQTAVAATRDLAKAYASAKDLLQTMGSLIDTTNSPTKSCLASDGTNFASTYGEAQIKAHLESKCADAFKQTQVTLKTNWEDEAKKMVAAPISLLKKEETCITYVSGTQETCRGSGGWTSSGETSSLFEATDNGAKCQLLSIAGVSNMGLALKGTGSGEATTHLGTFFKAVATTRNGVFTIDTEQAIDGTTARTLKNITEDFNNTIDTVKGAKTLLAQRTQEKEQRKERLHNLLKQTALCIAKQPATTQR